MEHPSRRTVLVTGASRGLGRAIAMRFGNAGSRVAVHYRERRHHADDAAIAIAASGGEAFTVQADIRSTAEVERMMRTVEDRWGRIDVLVNNAGIVHDGLAMRMPEGAWDDVYAINLKGAFACIRAVARTMVDNRSGHIISIASMSGVHGRAGQVNYSASKAGLIGLTKAAAREFGRYNIRVNAVMPGYLPTSLAGASSGDVARQVVQDCVLRRSSTLEEIADFVLHLAAMEHVSGQIFNLDSRIL